MKQILSIISILLLGSISQAQEQKKCEKEVGVEVSYTEAEVKHFAGERVADADSDQLKKHLVAFCEGAPGQVAKLYGQNVFWPESCECGTPSLYIKEGQRYFVVKNVKSAYGSRYLALISALTTSEGKDIFGGVRTLSIGE